MAHQCASCGTVIERPFLVMGHARFCRRIECLTAGLNGRCGPPAGPTCATGDPPAVHHD